MKKTKILAIALAFTFIATAFVGSNVYAREYAATPINAAESPTSLTITRTVNGVTNPVTNTFTYTITADSHNPTDTNGGTNPVPTVNGMPATQTLTFTNVTPNASNVATQTATLDLSGVTFNELGDYKFVVTETASSDATTYPVDSTNSYEIGISVRNETSDGTDGKPVGTPTGNLVVTLEYAKDLSTGTKLDPLNLNFVSASVHTYIEISKNVTGDAARRDEYFPFEITLNHTNVRQGDKISVGVTNGTYYTTGNQYSTETVDANKKITVYAKHDQTIVIGKDANNVCQLPVGTQYTIAESNYSPLEPYTTTIDGDADDDKTITKTTVAVGDTNFNTANKTAYVNNSVLPALTGIFINVAPFVLLIAIAFIGIVLIKKSSKKEDK